MKEARDSMRAVICSALAESNQSGVPAHAPPRPQH
jgi:hypothetical protein